MFALYISPPLGWLDFHPTEKIVNAVKLHVLTVSQFLLCNPYKANLVIGVMH